MNKMNKINDPCRSEVDRQVIHIICHVQHDLSAGYPFRFDGLLIEGAVNQNVAILGGTRGSLDFPGEPVSTHLAMGNLHLVNRD